MILLDVHPDAKNISKLKNKLPQRFDLASGECKMECTLFDVDDKSGKCVSAESMRIE